MSSRKVAPRSSRQPGRRTLLYACIFLGALTIPAAANAKFPAWMQHIVGASTVESALYRAMQLPAVQALYPRPPKEATTQLSQLIATNPSNAELYQLRAQADEQALDEAAAESDWKLYVTHSPDPTASRLELADFYERRLLILQEIAVLNEVAAAPPIPSETYVPPTAQRSWVAFERILGTIYRQGLPPTQTASTFDAFITRYPDQPVLYAAFLQFQARAAGLVRCPIRYRAIRQAVHPRQDLRHPRPGSCLSFTVAISMPPSLSTIMPSSRSGLLSWFGPTSHCSTRLTASALSSPAAREQLATPPPTAPKHSMRSPASSTTTSRRDASPPLSKPSTPSA